MAAEIERAEIGPLESLVNAGKFEITERGVVFFEAMSLDEFESALRATSKMDQATQWAYGDFLNEAERQHGESYAQLMDATGLSYGTLANYKWVSGRFPIADKSSPRGELSWSHHRELAGVDDLATRRSLMEAAERGTEYGPWSVGALRSAIAAIRLGSHPEPIPFPSPEPRPMPPEDELHPAPRPAPFPNPAPDDELNDDDDSPFSEPRQISDEERAYDNLVRMSLITGMSAPAVADAVIAYRNGSGQAYLDRLPAVIAWLEQLRTELDARYNAKFRVVR